MRVAFRELPETGDYARPVLSVTVEDLALQQDCLIDTGALQNRFGWWVAEAAGVNLDEAMSGEIALGGLTTVARTHPVRLRVGDIEWEAPVSFCKPWPFGFHLLGQEGFLRWFDISISVTRQAFEIELAR